MPDTIADTWLRKIEGRVRAAKESPYYVAQMEIRESETPDEYADRVSRINQRLMKCVTETEADIPPNSLRFLQRCEASLPVAA